MEQDLLILIGGIALAVGTLASSGYYFARYLIKPEHDPEGPTAGSTATATATARKFEPAEQLPAPPPEKRPKLELVTPAEPLPNLARTLSGTRDSFWGKIQRTLTGKGQITGAELESIEEILYTSDLGTTTVTRLLDSVETQLSKTELRSLEAIKGSLKAEVTSILTAIPNMGHSPLTDIDHQEAKPQIWMIVGVNGVGKTTTIGKLAHIAASQNKKVLVAAGDTFRAAAQSQLKIWSERAQVEIFAPENVKDPGAVAFDAVQMAKARQYDLVLIDTAGRLHTQDNLMEELKKVKRVIQKLDPQAPHQTLIVLDANSGQNALVQAQKFNDTLKLSGAIFTKMDGTAKGGVVLGLASQLHLPTVFLGVGESMDALTGFHPGEYAEALFDDAT